MAQTDSPRPSPDAPALRLHGLKLSYFTGKLEAYLRAKGLAYTFIEMDTADFRRCARASGVAQMPQLETADGTWLTDTTAIMAHFEAGHPSPAVRPADPVAAFASLLFEDLFDEWLWRPALYHRWANPEDARLMSTQIARTMLRDVPAPLWLRRRLILARQRRVYLHQDGVTPTTAPQIEALYLNTLDALEPIFRTRPFFMGQRPCEADFGLFGSMFRHFFSDPTPAALMRERAPAVAAWVTRLWAARPGDLAEAAMIADPPADLAPFWAMASEHFLPYLAANAEAVAAGAKQVRYTIDGTPWSVPASPYRAHGLRALQQHYVRLSEPDRLRLRPRLGGGQAILAAPPGPTPPPPDAGRRTPVDRHWKP